MRGSSWRCWECAALVLAGCAGGLDSVHTGNFFVQPGNNQFLKCPDLAQRSVAGSNREKELVGLMERANQGTAGPVVNAMVYSADLQQVRADLQEVHATMREKGLRQSSSRPPRSSRPRRRPGPQDARKP